MCCAPSAARVSSTGWHSDERAVVASVDRRLRMAVAVAGAAVAVAGATAAASGAQSLGRIESALRRAPGCDRGDRWTQLDPRHRGIGVDRLGAAVRGGGAAATTWRANAA